MSIELSKASDSVSMTEHGGGENLKRWDVTLTGPNGRGAHHTFTWAVTRAGATARVARILDQDAVFEGWSFTIDGVPANVVRCVACNGPIKSDGVKPHACADCGRHIYVTDDLVRPGYHWECQDGWLTSVETH